jgi:hypothetical protein
MFRSLLYDHPQGSSFVLSVLPLLRLFCFVQLLIRYVAVCVYVSVCPVYLPMGSLVVNDQTTHRQQTSGEVLTH